MKWFILGVIIGFYICGAADTKAIKIGKIKIKGQWYKLIKI